MVKVYFSSWNGNYIDERSKNPEERLDLQQLNIPAHLDETSLKAFVGWAGLVVVDPSVNIVEIMRNYFHEVQKESCGRCIPCRIGTKLIADRLDKLVQGKGVSEDLDELQRLGRLIKDSSLCELGQSSPVPLLDALEHFADDFNACLEEGLPGAEIDSLRFRPVLTAPCRNGCPAHIDIPGYVRAIKEGCYEESLALIREKSPLVGVLGRVCVHPCESNCNRQLVDGSISIRVLKRFVADFAIKNGETPQVQVPDSEQQRVAIIGSGPAGLNAAYQLALKGYGVTIFEALPVAGGMLAVGIPSYRLPWDILNHEINLVKSLGVEIRLNTEVGKDVTLEQLKQEGYQAIFIATGLHKSATMGMEGEEAGYKGFIPGVEFLLAVNLNQPLELGEKLAVIGGGNVAMDCARSAVRLGVKEVYLVYRRSRAEMPANEAEIIAAEEEGVKFYLLANPTRILAEDGRVTGIECSRMELGEPDSSGRRRPVPIKGAEFILDVDIIVPAIGQVSDLSFLTADSGIEVTKRGTVVTDASTMSTTTPGIFAGGDAVLGARTVIEAVASGNKAAEAIDTYLREGETSAGECDSLEQFIEKMGVYNPAEIQSLVGGRDRQEEECTPVEERLQGFCEAELGYADPQTALRESERCACCLRLGLVVV